MNDWIAEQGVYARHVLALFRPGSAAPVHQADRNTAGSMSAWKDDDLKTLVEEGRRQLDRQYDDLERVRNRAQAILAYGLVLVGTVGALWQPVSDASCAGLWALWIMTLLVAAWAVLGAAATAAVRADMSMIHAAVLSHYERPVLGRLAGDYVASVMAGHNQVSTRLTNFRLAVTFLLIAAAMALGTWFWAQRAAPEPKDMAPAAHLCASPYLARALHAALAEGRTTRGWWAPGTGTEAAHSALTYVKTPHAW